MKQITMIFFSFLLVFIFLETAEGQTTLYSDDFNGDNGKGKIGTDPVDLSGVDWSVDVTDGEFTSSSDIFGVQSGVFEATNVDGNVIWESESISISGSNNLEFSFDAGAVGDFEASGDIFDVEIIIDNGTPQTLFTGVVDEDVSGDPMFFDSKQLTNTLQNFTTSINGSGTNAVIRITVNNNAGNELYKFDNLSIDDSAVEPEPTNHVSNFTASSNSISSINLSWTDASGTTLPENYLILVSDSGNFTAPEDGTEQTDDNDLSDGVGVINVAYGIESASFSDLESNTKYYFEIYPYTNLSSNIDYKTNATVPSVNVSTLEKPDLVLNEILADPANDLSGDANNDGIRNSNDDEFLEFVNTSSSDLDISGWTISDESSARHTFFSDPATVLGPGQAIVIFGGGNPTGVFGGSLVQTTSSLSLGNSGETITVKDETGNILIEHNYPGASDQSETRNPDLTGNFNDHTSADSDDNSAFSPGTRIDGSPFQSSETLSVTFDNGEGWRMLSSPTSGNTFHDLLGNIWTQGTSGADYSGGEPNVMIFDGTSFTAVNNLQSDVMNNGQGFIIYVYSDDDYDQTAQDNGFPKTLNLSGVPRTGYVEAPLTSGSGNFSLVGNPYNEPIDWDDLSTNNLGGTVYVYDHSYGNVTGEDVEDPNVGGGYRTWNSNGVGSLTGGIIAPFQGFWVQNSDSNPSLTFTKSDQTTGGTFYTKENENVTSIRLRSKIQNMFSETFLSFTESGQLGHDKNDGLKLSPLDFRDYISLSTEVEGTQMDINNLPVELYNPVEIPLHVQAFEAVESGWTLMGGEITISWPEMNNIPSEWEITLADTKLNKTIDLKNANKYVFEAEESRAKIHGKEPFSPFNPKPFQKEKAVSDARFLIIINPNVPDGLIDDDIPDQFTLEQNYPNPFNPTTNIKFEIAETSNVMLNVYNVMGQRVATLVNEVKAPGTYDIAWDARDMASGIYYYRLRADGVVFNRQMTLIK